MFVTDGSHGTTRKGLCVALSFAVHVVLMLALWAHVGWAPIVLVRNTNVIRSAGRGPGTSAVIVTLPSRAGGWSLHQAKSKQRKSSHPKRISIAFESGRKVSDGEKLRNAGPILKAEALWFSPHDVQVALPQTAPLPNVKREVFPVGFEGDVVVEVVIDRQGDVVRAKVEQGIAAIDKQVLATLLRWKFKPATYDGVPVASLQDVYFHYPDDAIR